MTTHPAHLVRLLLLLTAPLLRADLTITQELEQEGGKAPQTMTIKIKGDKMRNDTGSATSMILDGKSGDMITLIHAQKAVMRLSPEAVKMARQAMGAQSKDPNHVPDVKPTGRRETINGFACEEYAGTFHGGKIQVWAARGIPEEADIKSHLKALSQDSGPDANLVKSDVEGLPIRTTIEFPGVGRTTMTVLSIRRDPLPDADFQIPRGYQEIKMPIRPGR